MINGFATEWTWYHAHKEKLFLPFTVYSTGSIDPKIDIKITVLNSKTWDELYSILDTIYIMASEGLGTNDNIIAEIKRGMKLMTEEAEE